MYKEEYEKPKMNITEFMTEDVIDASGKDEIITTPGDGTQDSTL